MDKQTKNQKNMTIAISAPSNTLEGLVFNRFARAPYFLIITLKDNNVSSFNTIKNIQNEMSTGSGISVSEMLANYNVNAIITGNIGPRALDVLSQFNIPVFQSNDSVTSSIDKFINNQLPQF